MRQRILLFMLFFSLVLSVKAQFNDYKYIVIPVKFDVFKNQNQYKTSTLIKHLLVKKGFNVVYSDNLPSDLEQKKCIGLYVDLLDDSTLFKTKSILIFNNCYGDEVYRTLEGTSKEKEYEPAYREAIEEAVSSMGNITYSYQAKSEEQNNTEEEKVTLNFKDDVKKVEKQIPSKKDVEVVIKEESTTSGQTYKAVEVEKSKIAKKVNETEVSETEESSVLYAQSTKDGYQLVDTTPKVVYILTSTTVPDIFLVEAEGINSGLIFKKESKWFLEYSNSSGKVVKELNIKF